MKLAKASPADLEMAMELCAALEALTCRWDPSVPEKIARLKDREETERYDRHNAEQNARVMEYLRSLVGGASLMRVVYGCTVMLDPANRCVDPDADTIEHHPDILELAAAKALQPIDQYHEDIGDVLWWALPIEEPPWCGSPLDNDWPGYHTHWSPLVIPTLPEPTEQKPC